LNAFDNAFIAVIPTTPQFYNWLKIVQSLIDGKGAMLRAAILVQLSLVFSNHFANLGRGWSFDDIEEATSISQETHHIFFSSFSEEQYYF
jgi:hypothetical protein